MNEAPLTSMGKLSKQNFCHQDLRSLSQRNIIFNKNINNSTPTLSANTRNTSKILLLILDKFRLILTFGHLT